MIDIYSALAFFILLIVSSVVFFIARKIKVPYTVLLVLVGLILVPLVQLPRIEPVLGFLTNLALTPELLFYIFLPILIFESAFNMNMRKMIESAWSISALAIGGMLVSALVIATALFAIFPLIGLPIPFIIALLFGAIISSTDPVAVLALFKEYGAPKRLTLIFEGESLFNDGTAVALFLVVLAIAQEGFHGTATIVEGIGIFAMMVFLGIGFGIFMAALFSRGLRYARSNEFVSITALVVSAHIVFILSELINQNPIFGIHFHISPIIATTVAALFLGNYARHTLSPRSDEYLAKSIEHLAFVANSLVFLLAGILFATIDINFEVLLLPILLTIIIVATARIISVYAVVPLLNALKLEATIPKRWQALLAWGSLRGALAIIVVLLIPDGLRPEGWNYAFSPKELLLAMTIGCILFTLFLKALTIGPLMKKLQTNLPTPFRKAYEVALGMYYLQTELDRLEDQRQRGFVPDSHYHQMDAELQDKLREAQEEQEAISKQHPRIFIQVLRHIAIEVEARYLKELYVNDEVTEPVYRRLKGKLNLQKEKIEHDRYEDVNPSLYMDRKDVFDKLVSFVHNANVFKSQRLSPADRYMYYRAQSVLSRKVLATLQHMQAQYGIPTFDTEAYDHTVKVYETFHKQAQAKEDAVMEKHQSELEDLTTELSQKALRLSSTRALTFMNTRGIGSESLLEGIEHRFQV
jgi:CPA1 family monovalent cation:H+ antiporter